MSKTDSSESDWDTTEYPYLASLNDAQLRAVTAPPTVPLQILAGPGSGKTRVLTSRVAHLVRCHGYKPYTITAVTFTNKAAAEMRKRLIGLLGEQEASQLVVGTFHATCVRYLRRYGSRIGLVNNFAIADADYCKKIVSRLLKDRKDELEEAQLQLKEGSVLSEISKAKAKGETSEGMALRAQKAQRTLSVEEMATPDVLGTIAKLYALYQAELESADALDFDDLLGYGLKLFTTDKSILEKCRHILVDEFQDTNTTQYELMKSFARAHPDGGVSIVGDPDQSIYGWRSAEVENLDHMRRDFKNVKAIHLEENYRSTGAILAVSHSIVSQDPQRIKKDLFTSHPKSTPVTLKLFSTPTIEASFIATEIKRMVAYSGEMLNYDDFAILLRQNALSRVIESALQKEGIPNRIIGGHKFFEREEIKDILAYLQLADNPNFTPAFMRIINVPPRGIGAKSLECIVGEAKKRRLSPMEICQDIAAGGKAPSYIKGKVEKISEFVSVVDQVRGAALMGREVGDLIGMIVEQAKYQPYLATKKENGEERWQNVEELVSFSVSVAKQGLNGEADAEAAAMGGFAPARTLIANTEITQVKPKVEKKPAKEKPQFHAIFAKHNSASKIRSGKKAKQWSKVDEDGSHVVLDSDDSDDAIEEFDAQDFPASGEKSVSPDDDSDGLNPLRFFLQSSMLSTDTQTDDDGADVPKVTISTVHSAKGLEWPVVFVPAVEHGSFPSARSVEEREIAEERRLLYVAMTRAQVFLTLTHAMSRMVGGETQDRNLSEFIDKSLRKDPNIVTGSMPTIDEVVRKQMCRMIGRPLTEEKVTEALIMKHVRAAPPLSTWDAPEREYNRFARHDGPGPMSRGFDYWANDVDEYAPSRASSSGSRPGFSSAKSFMPPHGAPSVPKPPVQRLQSSNRNLPAPLPFTFNEPAHPATSLSTFTSGSNLSLAAMKTLGLPETTGGATGSKKPSTAATRGFTKSSTLTRATGATGSTMANPASVSSTVGASFEYNRLPSAGLARPDQAYAAGQVTDHTGGALPGSAAGPSSTTPLARGTKRTLGMRRAVAPWPSKRGKTD